MSYLTGQEAVTENNPAPEEAALPGNDAALPGNDPVRADNDAALPGNDAALPGNDAVRAREKATKARKRRARRRLAKGLLWFALLLTGLLVLAEPWLLVPIGAAVVAVALRD